LRATTLEASWFWTSPWIALSAALSCSPSNRTGLGICLPCITPASQQTLMGMLAMLMLMQRACIMP
jgi:hypothetical protein